MGAPKRKGSCERLLSCGRIGRTKSGHRAVQRSQCKTQDEAMSRPVMPVRLTAKGQVAVPVVRGERPFPNTASGSGTSLRSLNWPSTRKAAIKGLDRRSLRQGSQQRAKAKTRP